MDFMYPLANYVTITQGYHSGHLGMDFGWNGSVPGANGQPIIAAESGTVIACADGWGNTYPSQNVYGNYAIVAHGSGWWTVYGHLKKGITIKNGQAVSKGQTLGYMGDTGYSKGQHLHFELRKGSNLKSCVIDCLPYLTVQNNAKISDASLFRNQIKRKDPEPPILTPVKRDESVDQIEIVSDVLNVRENASINAGRLGYAPQGYFNIISSQKAGDYTWFQVEPGKWTALVNGGSILHPKADGDYLITAGPMIQKHALEFKALAESLNVPFIQTVS